MQAVKECCQSYGNRATIAVLVTLGRTFSEVERERHSSDECDVIPIWYMAHREKEYGVRLFKHFRQSRLSWFLSKGSHQADNIESYNSQKSWLSTLRKYEELGINNKYS